MTNYVNASAQGLNLVTHKPANPVVGDTYFDINDGCMYAYIGSAWAQVSDRATPPKPIVTLEEVVELYPDLKDLANKYMEWEILKRSK